MTNLNIDITKKYLVGSNKCWICSIDGSKKCLTYLTMEEIRNILEVFDNHNHPLVDEKILNKYKISDSLKRKASDGLSERPMKLIQRTLRKRVVKKSTNCNIKRIKNYLSSTKEYTTKIAHKPSRSLPCS